MCSYAHLHMCVDCGTESKFFNQCGAEAGH